MRIESVITDLQNDFSQVLLGFDDPIKAYADIKKMEAFIKEKLADEQFKETVINEVNKFAPDERKMHGFQFVVGKESQWEFEDDAEILKIKYELEKQQEAYDTIKAKYKEALDVRKKMSAPKVVVDKETGEAYTVNPAVKVKEVATLTLRKPKK